MLSKWRLEGHHYMTICMNINMSKYEIKVNNGILL